MLRKFNTPTSQVVSQLGIPSTQLQVACVLNGSLPIPWEHVIAGIGLCHAFFSVCLSTTL